MIKIIYFFIFLSFIFFVSYLSMTFLPSHYEKLIHNVDDLYIYKIKNRFEDEKTCLIFGELSNNSKSLQGCIFSKNSKIIATSYTKLILASLYFNPKPQNILILGLGIGTMPRVFSEIATDAHIDVIDINPHLNGINKEYFDFDINNYENISFHLIDAFEFVKNAGVYNKQYDLIINDVFDSSYIPQEFLTDNYMQSLKRILSDDGILVNNSFTSSKTRDLEDRLINDNFGKHYIYLQKENKIVITNKDNETMPMQKIDEDNQNFLHFKTIFKKFGVDSDELLKLLNKA